MCSPVAHHVRGSFIVFYIELNLNFLYWVPACSTSSWSKCLDCWTLPPLSGSDLGFTAESEGPGSCKPAGGGYDISDNGNASASCLANNVLSGTGVTHAAVLFSVYLCPAGMFIMEKDAWLEAWRVVKGNEDHG